MDFALLLIAILWLGPLALILWDAATWGPARSRRASVPQDNHATRMSAFSNMAIAIISTVALLVAVFAYSISKGQLDAMQVQSRAFVTVNDIKIIPEFTRSSDKQELFGWTFDPNIKNAGNTPTKDMRYIVLMELSGQDADQSGKPRLLRRGIELPAEPFDPDDYFASMPDSIDHAFLGPQAIVPQAFRSRNPIPNGNVGWIVNGQSRGYIFGSIHYRDIFPNTPERVTKFCLSLNGRYSDAGELKPSFSLCQYWNCADDECKADKQRYNARIRDAVEKAKFRNDKPPS